MIRCFPGAWKNLSVKTYDGVVCVVWKELLCQVLDPNPVCVSQASFCPSLANLNPPRNAQCHIWMKLLEREDNSVHTCRCRIMCSFYLHGHLMPTFPLVLHIIVFPWLTLCLYFSTSVHSSYFPLSTQPWEIVNLPSPDWHPQGPPISLQVFVQTFSLL